MRLWHVLVLVFLVAMALSVWQSEYGRITLVLFLTGIGEVAVGATALMNLFKSVGAFGNAKSFQAHVEALVATALILTAGSIGMTAVLWFGGVVIQMVSP
jgi:hypothetical protein